MEGIFVGKIEKTEECLDVVGRGFPVPCVGARKPFSERFVSKRNLNISNQNVFAYAHVV